MLNLNQLGGQCIALLTINLVPDQPLTINHREATTEGLNHQQLAINQ